MGDQSRFERPPGPDRHSRRGRIFVLTLLAVALIVPLGVYETIPVKQHKATAPPPPDPTVQAIHDLGASLQQAVSQLRALQQAVSSDPSPRPAIRTFIVRSIPGRISIRFCVGVS